MNDFSITLCQERYPCRCSLLISLKTCLSFFDYNYFAWRVLQIATRRCIICGLHIYATTSQDQCGHKKQVWNKETYQRFQCNIKPGSPWNKAVNGIGQWKCFSWYVWWLNRMLDEINKEEQEYKKSRSHQELRRLLNKYNPSNQYAKSWEQGQKY